MSAVLGALGVALGAGPLTMSGKPESGGWSNETVFVIDGNGTKYVVRTVPQHDSMFDDHDIGFQRDCMIHARAHGLCAPRILLSDLEGEILGVPGFVMENMPGRVPHDKPPTFVTAGFLYEASETEQERFHASLVSAIGDLHQIPVPEFPIRRASPAEALDHLQQSRVTDRCDGGDDILDAAHAELAERAPSPVNDAVFLWGDARPANTIVDDGFRVSAMLDWELAFVGQAEHDVAWLFEMNRMRAPEDSGGRVLPGFASDVQTWRLWESHVGRTAVDPAWYSAVAAVRVAVFLERSLWAAVRRGDLPSDHWVLSDNRALRRVAELLE